MGAVSPSHDIASTNLFLIKTNQLHLTKKIYKISGIKLCDTNERNKRDSSPTSSSCTSPFNLKLHFSFWG